MWGAFKKLSFFATGVGVAVDLAATKASPIAATVGNLTAVAGGSAYSISKNFETASNISEQRQNCSEMLNEMHGWTETDNTEDLLRRLEIPEEEARNLLTRINIADGNTKRGYIYAAINTAIQVTLGAISIGINAAASQKSDDDIWHDSIHIMNMFLIPTLIFSQYIFHSAFAARSLRGMNDQNIELKSDLEKLKNSVQAQGLKLNNLVGKINIGHQQLMKLNEDIGQDHKDLSSIEQQIRQVGSQPIAEDMEEQTKRTLKGLERQQGMLKQRIISNSKSRDQIITILKALVDNANKLKAALKISFTQCSRFEDMFHHLDLEALRTELDQEISGLSSASLGV